MRRPDAIGRGQQDEVTDAGGGGTGAERSVLRGGWMVEVRAGPDPGRGALRSGTADALHGHRLTRWAALAAGGSSAGGGLVAGRRGASPSGASRASQVASSTTRRTPRPPKASVRPDRE